MKKLNLDETWKRCLAMWRWIVQQRGAGNQRCVTGLKEQWVEKHYPDDWDLCCCYLCAYARTHPRSGDSCSGCPARRIDPAFYCMADAYNYDHTPIAFLRKLEQLNRKRLAEKKGVSNG